MAPPPNRLEDARAFKPLFEALTQAEDPEEAEWLDTKFERSGQPRPTEGELTVVIEYCFNSGLHDVQLSTKHGEKRYHEEAELVMRYFLNYYPGAVVKVLASDFRTRSLAAPGTRVRLGAFEIHARLCVDGTIVTCELWSKLRTGKWPMWPDWQDEVRKLVPVFELVLRPCFLRSDGSTHFLPDARVIVMSRDGGRVVDSFVSASAGERRGGGGGSGVLVRLLRGTFTVRVPEPASGEYFEEQVSLDLTRVPLPRSNTGPLELRVPVGARPKLRIVLQGPHSGDSRLKLPFCAATLADVRLTVTDRSALHDGEVLFSGPATKFTGEIFDINSVPSGVFRDVDLMPYRSRIPPRHSDLSEALWADGSAHWPADGGHAIREGALGGYVPVSTDDGSAPPGMQGTWAAPRAAGAPGSSSSNAQVRYFLAAVDSGAVEAAGDSSRGARLEEERGWVVEVEATLTSHGNVPLDMTLSRARVAMGRGGANDVMLRVARLSRQVRVTVSAAKDGSAAPWAAALPIGDVALEVTHSSSSTLITQAVASSTLPPMPQLTVDGGVLAGLLGNGAQAGLPAAMAMAMLPVPLPVNESATFRIAPPTHGADHLVRFQPRTYPPRPVLAGEGAMDVELLVDRLTADLRIEWSMASSRGSVSSHWAARLPMVDGFSYIIRHVGTKATVLGGVFSHSSVRMAGAGAAAGRASSSPPRSPRSRPPPTAGGSDLERLLGHAAGGTEAEEPEDGMEREDGPPRPRQRPPSPPPRPAVAPAELTGPLETLLSGASCLFVGETYQLEVGRGAEMGAEPLVFHVTSPETVSVRYLLRRTCAALNVRIRPAATGGSGHHWSAALGLPAGIAFAVHHAATGELVVTGQTDAKGDAYVPEQEGLFVGEGYQLRVGASQAVKAGQSAEFELTEGGTAADGLGMREEDAADPFYLLDPQLAGVAERRAHVAVLYLERASVEVHVHLQPASMGSEQWWHALASPPQIPLRVAHAATKAHVGGAISDNHGRAIFGQSCGLFMGEIYTVEVGEGAGSVRGASANFCVEAPRVDPATGLPVPQVVHLPIERQTNDITLSVKVRAEGSAAGSSSKHDPAAPSGLKYTVVHEELGREVASGFTDQVGKSVLKRRGTLFVGETYVVRTEGGEGISPAAVRFVVLSIEEEPRQQVTLFVERACANLSLELQPLLRGTQHWAHSLQLPDGIVFELVHVESAVVVHSATYPGRATTVDGRAVGLYVGERYKLRVLSSGLVEAAEVDVSVSSASSSTVHLLKVPRSFASVDVVLRSVHAGTGHWSSSLPLPAGVPLKVMHKGLGCAVCAGVTDSHSRVPFLSKSMCIVTGEEYYVVVDSTDMCASTGEHTFVVRSRQVEVACAVRRCVSDVTIGCRYAKADTGHWSSALSLPDGIGFNVHHKALGCPVTHGATRSSERDSVVLSTGTLGRDAARDHLFVGETYIVEIPSSHQVKATSREFTVNSEPKQMVTVPVERKVGRVMVRLDPGQADLPLPTNISLNLKHLALDLRVMPPFPIGSDRAELHADDTLLVGETYELSAVANGAVEPRSTSFTVKADETVVAHLMLERTSTDVTLVFRAQQPGDGPGATGGGRAPSARHGRTQWSGDLELPKGLVYEVRHKATERVVAHGATLRRDVAPRVSIAPGCLYVGETYLLKALPGFGLHGGSCEFYVRSVESQEVTLLVRRATCGVGVAFKAVEAQTDHWASSLPLPKNVPFKVIHKASGTTVHEGDGGSTNRVALPSDLLFTGEEYMLQSLASRHILASRVDFVVRGSTSAAVAASPTKRGAGIQYGQDTEEIELAIDRAVGDVRLVLRSVDGRPLPVGVPFAVMHAQLGAAVVDGRTTLSGLQVECDAWFVNQGALYVGEQYTFSVPTGNGFTTTAKTFTVGAAAERAKARTGPVGTTVVELELSREFASATMQLLSDKAGTLHWSEPLPLPPSMTVYVRLAHDHRQGVGTKVVAVDGKTQAHVNLTPDIPLVAHQRYTLEMQQSAQVLRSTAELAVGSGSKTASATLYVSRAWVPAVVVVLRTADQERLPAGLKVKVLHAALACVVAECQTTESDTAVRCLLHVPEAFYVGEQYTATVESNFGVGGAMAPFVVDENMAEPVELNLSRASSEVKARLFPLLPAPSHWSRKLTVPPQQLEVLHNQRVVASTNLAWARGVTDLYCMISKLVTVFVGHRYTLRVAESPSVQGLSVQFVAEEAAQIVDLPLRRRSFGAVVTVKSKQELPLPYGIKVQLRHKDTMALVAAGKVGEPEVAKFDGDVSQAAHDSLRTESEKQVGVALRKVSAFLADGNDIYFNGAGENGLPNIEQSWSVNHLDRRYKAQNWKTIDGIVAILREFDQIALEVHGETGPADHAPPNLARHFGLDRTLDVQRLMDRLAESRAEACRQALILRGVRAERLFVSFKGRGGHIRTDFIPRSLHDASALSLTVTQMMKPQSAAGAIVFHSPAERQLQSVSQAWTLEHTDSAVRLQNHAAVEAVASVMLRYPLLHLEVCITIASQNADAAPRRLLDHFGAATAAHAPTAAVADPQAEALRVFQRYDADGSGDIDARELRAALQGMGLVTDGSQAAAVLAKYDADFSGSLALDEFTRLVSELRRFQTSAGSSAVGADSVANVFNRYDSDRSGDIDASELRDALRGMGLPTDTAQAATVLAKYDADRSGRLDLPEFRRLVDELRRFQAAASPTAPLRQETAEEVFRRYDRDRSGDIDVAELRDALQGVGLDTSGTQAGAVLAKYDADSSGRLELFEFRQLVNELQRFQAAATPSSAAASDSSPSGMATSNPEAAHRAYEQLARARAGAILSELQRLQVPAKRTFGSYLVGGAVDTVTFAARTEGWRRAADDDETHKSVGKSKAARERKIYLGRELTGHSTHVALQRPTVASVRIVDPDALYPGERYLVETVAMPSLGVPYASHEFTMPEHEQQLSLAIDRPTGDINLVLVDARSRSGHWSASLPMPTRAKIRIRHATLGVVFPEQEIFAATTVDGSAVPQHDVLRVFQRYDTDRSGDIDARELHMALRQLGLATDGPQAASVLAKYDRDRSGRLELDEFTRLIAELRRFQTASGAADVAMADGTSRGPAVLRYELKSQLFVGETYTLEVLDSAELHAAKREFHVQYVDQQSVEISLSRKWRDVTAVLRYVQDEVEAVPMNRLAETITVVARHKALNKVATSGAAREGAADLPGVDALYVGMSYLLEVSETEFVSARTTEVTITPGTSPLVIDLPLGPASGTVHVKMRDMLRDSGNPLEMLPLPPIHYSIFPKPRTGRVKAAGTTDRTGQVTLRAGAQLFVGRRYTLEVSREINRHVIESATAEFVVVRGEQTVRLNIHRAAGTVKAIFTTVHANRDHWSAPLKLPAPFEYRIVHKWLGVVVDTLEVPRQPSHTVTWALPATSLFVNETYYLEVGYQLKAIIEELKDRLRVALRGRGVHFRDPGAQVLPSVESSWSLEYHDDDAKREQNHQTLDAVAALLRAYPMVCLDVHAETGLVADAPERLASYYKLRRDKDVHRLMDHLARNRAAACVDALVERGIDARRLGVTYRGLRGSNTVAFRPRAGHGSKLGDPRSGLTPLRVEFTVSSKEMTGGVQEVLMALEKATGDINLLFRSAHADPAHWSHFLAIPPGLRLNVRHTALDKLVTEGVVTSDDNACYIVGDEAPRQLYCMEHYSLDLEGGRFFEQDPNALLLEPGAQDVLMRVTWATRLVRCYVSSADLGSARNMKAEEAYARIKAFMVTHDVHFNGANDPEMARITQAWNILHTEPAKQRANQDTIAGIAAILREYPELRVEVHGETSAATTAPRPLADHFGLHWQHDVQRIMDQLARRRAEACRDALVAQGVPAEQLFVTYKGRGGNLSVDFIPEGQARTERVVSEAASEMRRALDSLAPLPAGIPYEVRLKKGGSIILAGMTTTAEAEVLCPLPNKERLVVGQAYIFEAFAGPGTEPNRCEFTINPDQVLERDILEIRLPVRRVAAGQVNVRCVPAVDASHWAYALPMPLSIGYHVVDHTGEACASGLASGSAPTPLNSFGLLIGSTYRLRVPPTKALAPTEMTPPFTMGQDARAISLPIRRQTAPITLVMYSSERLEREGHWASRLPLPPLFDVVLVHKGVQVVVQEFLVEEAGRSCTKPLDRSQFFVDEFYSVQVGCSVRLQTDRVAERLRALMAGKTIHFAGAGEERLRAIEDSWSVDFPLDGTKKQHNHDLLDEIAKLIGHYPGVELEVRGETGRADLAPPAELARHYKLRPRQDSTALMDHLARNRAAACVRALVARGVPESRLKVQYRSRTGRLQTEFVPIPGHGAAGFVPAVVDFRVAPEKARGLPQEVHIPLERATGDVLVRLVNARSDLGHWSSALSVASGVPITLRHKGLGIEVLNETVYDGEVLLQGANLFYINETYTVEVAATIRTIEAAGEVTVCHGVTTINIPIERPARRIELSLFNERLREDTERQAASARERIREFLIENDVFFNGAAEPATQQSARGTAQAWDIRHLDEALHRQNKRTLDGVAKIMLDHPDISLEVAGMTTENRTAQALGAYFNLHPTDDVKQLMDLLARRRGQACYDALVERGVDSARMWVTSNPMGTEMKVDFIPHTAGIPDQYQPLPAGMPFRLLHQRYTDHGLRQAMVEMRTFTDKNFVVFNGAGELHPEVQQAWNVDHTDYRILQANRYTLQGIASILRRYPDVRLEIHGETGSAEAAPRQLAAYLNLNRTSDVKAIMDKLSRYRAESCREHLIAFGVRREQLFVTYNGLGKHIRVDFTPRSMRPYAPQDDDGMELAVIHEGVTLAAGNQVLCPLPPNAALYVDETYVLQVPPPRIEGDPDLLLDDSRIMRRGSSHFRCVHAHFQVRAETEPEHVYVERLMVPRVRRGTVKITVHGAKLGTGDWTESLPLPGSIPFHVYRVSTSKKRAVDASIEEVFQRYDRDGSGDIDVSELRDALHGMGLPTDTAQAATVLAKYDADRSGRLELPEFTQLVNELRRFQAGKAVPTPAARTPAKAAPDDALDAFRRYDRDGSGDIDVSELRDALRGMGLPTDTAQAATVLAKYDADRSGRLELPEFRRLVDELKRFQEGQTAASASRDDVLDAFERYDTDGSGDIDVLELRSALTDMGLSVDTTQAAAVLAKFDKDRSGGLQLPEFRLVVEELRSFQGKARSPPRSVREHGSSARPLARAADTHPTAAPDAVEEAFTRYDGDRSGDIDVFELRGALQAMGLDTDTEEAATLLARFDTDRSGRLELKEFRTLVGELKQFQAAAAESRGVPLVSGMLHPTRPGYSGALFQADVLEPGVYYEVHIPATSTTRAATKRFVESANAVEVELVLERTARNVRVAWSWPPNAWYSNMQLPSVVPYALKHLGLKAEVGRGLLRHVQAPARRANEQLAEALERVRRLLSGSNSIVFNSVADESLPGVDQSWNVEYTNDDTKRRRNREVLDTLAQILVEFPEIGLNVHGETGLVNEAPAPLARYYYMRAREDVQYLCERLAHNRASACVDALIRRGIAPDRLLATYQARTGKVRVDFHPMSVEEIASKRRLEDQRLEAQAVGAGSALSTFMTGKEIVFNGAREPLTKRSSRGAAQAWAVEHAEPSVARANYAALDGVAAIMQQHPEISCEVHGSTTAPDNVDNKADEDLAAFFRLSPTGDMHRIMDLLAQRRAEACLEALVQRGVARRRLYTTYEGGAGAQTVAFVPHAAGRLGRHVTEDVTATFRKYDQDSSGSIDFAELRVALGELQLTNDLAEAEAIMHTYDADRSGQLELAEFGQLVHDLRRFRASAGFAPPIQPSICSLRGLPSGERYELLVAKDLVETAVHVEQFDPIGQPCRFDTNGSASGAAEDVTLRLTPLSQAVKVRVELGAVGIRGAQHWATGLASIDAVRYEVRHRRLDAVVLTGQFAAPSVTPLAHPGQLFIGEEYSITTLEGSLFHAATTFRVGAQPIEVVLRGALREAGLLVVFESANGKALPPGIQYRVRSTRAPRGARPLVDSKTSRSLPVVEEQVSSQLSGGFLLHDTYVLEVEGSAVEGGVASLTHEFTTSELRTVVRVQLQLRGAEATMKLVWLGPPMASRGHRGDGDDVAASEHEKVNGAIPFRVLRTADRSVLLSANKDKGPGPTEVGNRRGQHALFQGEQVTIQTEAASGWAAATVNVPIPYENNFEVKMRMARGGPQQQQQQQQQQQRGGDGMAIVLRAAYDGVAEWARALPPPPGLGFVISRDDGGYTASGFVPPPAAGSVVASGTFDASGRAGFNERAVPHGVPHRVHLAYAAPAVYGYANPPLVPITAESAAPAEPSPAVLFTLPMSPSEPLVVDLRRRTRDVRVIFSDGGKGVGTTRVYAIHPAVPSVAVAEAGAGSGDGDVSGGGFSCLLRGALYAGEDYLLHVGDQTPMRFTVVPAAVPAAGSVPEPQLIEFKMRAAGRGGQRWYDERPVGPDAARRADDDARRVHEALKGVGTDSKTIIAALARKPVEELQMMRHAFKRAHNRELREELARRSKLFSTKAARLEEMLVLTKAEVDVQLLKEGLEARHVELTRVLEVLCTSLPFALVELRDEFRRSERIDLADALRRQLDTADERRLDVHEAVLPLLLALVERAASAGAISTAAKQVSEDAASLHDAFRQLAARNRDAVLKQLVPLLAGRSRAHLALVSAEYRARHGSELRREISTHLGGSLLRAALLLLEPAEAYYSHMLHAALHGLNRTPELDELGIKTLGKQNGLLLPAFERAQSKTAFTPHDDTLVRVVALRYGRDLSGIAQKYREQYPRSLDETINDRTYGELRRVLREASSWPAYEPGYVYNAPHAEPPPPPQQQVGYGQPAGYYQPPQPQPQYGAYGYAQPQSQPYYLPPPGGAGYAQPPPALARPAYDANYVQQQPVPIGEYRAPPSLPPGY